MGSACDSLLGLGLPGTGALESGAAKSLSDSASFEMAGSYTSGATRWTVDIQKVHPDTDHVVVSDGTQQVEAIILGETAYFRGQAFLAKHMGGNSLSDNVVRAAGNAWWKGSAGFVPALPDLIEGAIFRATFLGAAVTSRIDHVAVDGVGAVELSGTRADVYIAARPPYELLRLRMSKGVTIDQISDADLRFKNFNRDFKIAAPTDVIDFSNLSTLPPIYTVVSVDTSGCTTPCPVTAVLKNLGGLTGASAPSKVTFTMTNAATQQAIGSCTATVQPDVGFNATTTVGCTINGLTGLQVNAAIVTATADNPGRGS